MLKVPIAVLVSGGGTNLEHLLLAEEAGQIPHGHIRLVISNNPEAYALTRAANAGIATKVITRRRCGSKETFTTALIEALDEARIDLIVLAGFMSILDKRFTDHFPKRIINIHPALIPSFCGEGFYGLKVHEAALAYGVKVTGATVHFVNEIPDGGEIIAQKAVDILPGDTPEVLQRRVMEEAEWILLPQAAEKVCRAMLDERRQTER